MGNNLFGIYGWLVRSKGNSAHCIKLGIRSLELAGDISIPQRRGLRERGVTPEMVTRRLKKGVCRSISKNTGGLTGYC